MDEPTLIEPDTKDWTVVVSEGCAECGYELPAPGEIAPRILDTIAFWPAAMAQSGVRERPAPSTWSPLEYACHVRDVCVVFVERAESMKSQDGVRFLNWDQDEAAVFGRYWEQDPATVAEAYEDAAARVAQAFASASPAHWKHTGLRSNGSAFTLATLGSYLLHDLEHHIHDVAAQRPAP